MTNRAGIAMTRDVISAALARRIFPAAVVEVGGAGGPIWREAFGALTFDEAAPPADQTTIFDLASLTKPIATTTLLLQLLDRGRMSLSDRVAASFEEWRGSDREHVTIQDLLEHASGLPARLVDSPPIVRREFEHEVCTIRLEYQPRTKSVYSDLGFILLGFFIEHAGGAPLEGQFASFLESSGLAPNDGRSDIERPPLRGRTIDDNHTARTDVLDFVVPPSARSRVAPTRPLDEDLRRGRLLVGEAHDNYAAALGGAAGHAGLFGTVAPVGRFARAMLRAKRGEHGLSVPFTPPLATLATTKSMVPGSSRALGWDTMLVTSSCGSKMSHAAFGHVGFTGTSLWIDPVLDRYFVLLTNRACDGGTLEQMREVRRTFHDAAVGIE